MASLCIICVKSSFFSLDSALVGRGAYLGNLNLDGGMVLGGNESVGGGALTGDVQIHNRTVVVLHCFEK